MDAASRLYLGAVVAAAAAAAAALAPDGALLRGSTREFALLTVAAAVAQLFVVRKPGFQALKPSIIFVVAAALLLPLELLPLLTLVQYLPEWLKTRTLPKVVAFNIANGVLDIVAAALVFRLVDGPGPATAVGLRFALGGLAASVVYVLVNHTLLAAIIALTSKSSLRATGLFRLEHLLTDFVIGGLGVGFAALAVHDVWTTPFLIPPLVLIKRALAIPQLEAEARIDAKTGLFNPRYFDRVFADELARARRFDRPLSLLMADLDLLREINNSHGHLAGDAVLEGLGAIFRSELRQYDVAGRFGGEEFSILLPETTPQAALETAERIRARVEAHAFEARTVREPIRATISIGVASFPKDGRDASELVHQADIAVYQAKLQGRNRVAAADPEHQLVPAPYDVPLAQPVEEDAQRLELLAAAPAHALATALEEPQQETREEARFRSLPRPLPFVVALVGVLGLGAGAAGFALAPGSLRPGMLALVVLVGVGQALSFELAEFEGAISVSAVGSLAGAAIFDYRAALPLALAAAVVDWTWRRTSLHHLVYNVATLTLSSLAAAAVFSLDDLAGRHEGIVTALVGLPAGGVYFAVNMTLVSVASALARRESPRRVFQEQFAWLLQHYVVYGFIGGVIAVAYTAAGLYVLAVFAVPLLLMRRTQEAYLQHTQRSTRKLREAADTIQAQNVSLERANRLLRERSTAAMESLSATVDARDAYTAGHSRRVQRLVLALGGQLGLSQSELDLLGHAALFHDIGKLAVPDAILLKRGPLTPEERRQMERHAEEGARIIERLGFLEPAVPWIRHHHESWDGTGYPDRLAGEQIPLGARVIHLADAIDSIVTTRIYRPARSFDEALAEVRSAAGTQFCPRCVEALERLLPLEPEADPPELAAAS